MHATHAIDAKNVVIDVALEQGKLSWRLSSSRYYWEFHGERREKFLKKHKIFSYIVLKTTLLFVKI